MKKILATFIYSLTFFSAVTTGSDKASKDPQSLAKPSKKRFSKTTLIASGATALTFASILACIVRPSCQRPAQSQPQGGSGAAHRHFADFFAICEPHPEDLAKAENAGTSIIPEFLKPLDGALPARGHPQYADCLITAACNKYVVAGANPSSRGRSVTSDLIKDGYPCEKNAVFLTSVAIHLHGSDRVGAESMTPDQIAEDALGILKKKFKFSDELIKSIKEARKKECDTRGGEAS